MAGPTLVHTLAETCSSRRLFLRTALVIAVFLLAAQWLLMPTTIGGNSMSPTLRDGQFALVSTQAYRFASPKRGDLVLVSGDQDLLVKRIIGLPGETVAIHESNVYVGSKPLLEPYL